MPNSFAYLMKSSRDSRSSFATGEIACPLSVAVIQPSAATCSERSRQSAAIWQRTPKASAWSSRSRPSATSCGA